MTPEHTKPMDRLCALCGERIGKHAVPAYGSNDERAGAIGLICPPMLTPAEKAQDLKADLIHMEVNMKRMMSKTIAAACGIAALDDRELIKRLEEVWVDGWRAHKALMDRKP